MRRLLFLAAATLGATTIAAATSSCAMSDADCNADGTCAGSPDAGGDGGSSSGNIGEGGVAEAAAPPAGCDQTADPKDPTAAVKCSDDSFALFVNASANAGGDGTKEHPFTKIGDALALVPTSGKHRIYICGTLTYPEHVEITSTTAAWLVGGWDCGTWAATTGSKPKVLPNDAGYALHIDSVTGDFRVEDMSFEAIAGTADKPSSIAAFVASSPNVTFTRVDLKANAGANGVNGSVGTTGTSVPADGTGSTPSTTTGGLATTCTCSSGGTTVGGRGGDVSGGQADAIGGLPVIMPPSPSVSTGAGSTNAQCSGTGQGGFNGSDASKAADAPTPKPGNISAAGWTPGDGAAGTNGSPGQGGGGAGGQSTKGAQNAGGAGGGCGGCGGNGGSGGKAGGASVALLTFAAPVVIENSSLASGTAGTGGKGQTGGAGAPGSNGGNRILSGCNGGSGGNGGNGGAGAGGSGGYSAAVLYAGSSPTNQGSTLTPGPLGKGGLGGIPTQNDGPDGQQGDLLEAPTL